MLIQVVKSKIHRVKVTGADLNYIGSITIDEALMEASNIYEGEKVIHRKPEQWRTLGNLRHHRTKKQW